MTSNEEPAFLAIGRCQICLAQAETMVEVTLPNLSHNEGLIIKVCPRCKKRVREQRIATSKAEGVDLGQRFSDEAGGLSIPMSTMDAMIDARLMTTFFGPGSSGKEAA